jgi:hypothetical protein
VFILKKGRLAQPGRFSRSRAALASYIKKKAAVVCKKPLTGRHPGAGPKSLYNGSWFPDADSVIRCL